MRGVKSPTTKRNCGEPSELRLVTTVRPGCPAGTGSIVSGSTVSQICKSSCTWVETGSSLRPSRQVTAHPPGTASVHPKTSWNCASQVSSMRRRVDAIPEAGSPPQITFLIELDDGSNPAARIAPARWSEYDGVATSRLGL